ncbi:MAG: hypothetical protein FWB93_02850 [Oscillospiraceae bacterium]|nr:hypothetical protein [Oscillospiraceae bacterium]
MIEITLKGNTLVEVISQMITLVNQTQTLSESATLAKPPVPAPAHPIVAGTAPNVGVPPTAPSSPQAIATPPPMPTTPPVGSVPVSAPQFTLEQIMQAGAFVSQNGKQSEALAVLQKHGVQALNQLPLDKYAEVAADLRALGAQI